MIKASDGPAFQSIVFQSSFFRKQNVYSRKTNQNESRAINRGLMESIQGRSIVGHVKGDQSGFYEVYSRVINPGFMIQMAGVPGV